MKKALILLLLVNVSAVYSQSKLRLGVNLEPQATWLTPRTDLIERDGARPGIAGGLLVEYNFHPNYGVATGLNLGIRGGSLIYNTDEEISTGEATSVIIPSGSTMVYNLTYISIPVGLKLKTNEIGYFTYFAELGFNQQLNVGAKGKSSGNNIEKDNVSKEINLFNMSYYFGGGLEYNIGGNTSIVAGIFFNNGFTDVLSNNDHKAVLNFLSFRLGVLF